jgi:uncharacterized membrane protein
VRVTTSYGAPLYFLKMFLGSDAIEVTTSALAYNLPLTGIAIGTGAADADTSQLDAYTSAITGSPWNLSAAEISALESARVGVFRFFDEIASELGSRDLPISTVQGSTVGLAAFADSAYRALSAQAPLPSADEQLALGALQRISQGDDGSSSALVSDIVALEAHQKRAAKDLVSAASDSFSIAPMTVLMGYLQASGGNDLVNLPLSLSVAGLSGVAVDAVAARPSALGGAGTPVITIGPLASSASSSAARVRLTISLLPILGRALASIPITIDVAPGSATISSIGCGPDIAATTDVAVSAETALVQFYVGTVSDNDLTDLTTPIGLNPTSILSNSDTLHFSRSDIDSGTTKTVDSVSSSATAMNQLAAAATALAIAPVPALLKPAVQALAQPIISTVLTALTGQIDTIFASIGLRVDYIDVMATSARCGIPVLVG